MQDRYRFHAHMKYFYWDEPYLFKYCPDQIFRRCVPEEEQRSILSFCHEQACGSHFGPSKTAEKILQCGFYWPNLFKDANDYCKCCPRCQQMGRITRRNQMPMNPIQAVEVFD